MRGRYWLILMVSSISVLVCVCLSVAVLAAGMLSPGETVGGYRLDQTRGPITGPAIAIVDVDGIIVSSGLGGTASRDLVPAIEAAGKDEDIKVILVRLNTPGGSVVASDEIYQALKQTGKPVVALMQEEAASGGYYISMAAGSIIANPNTTTGSIGVIMPLVNYEGLAEKIGVRTTPIKSGDLKDLGAGDRPLTDKERAVLQATVDDLYGGFVAIVSENRKLSTERVRELADGRIYSGRQALAVGLIDALGYERDAIAKAAELGGLGNDPRIVTYKRRPEGLTGFLAGALQDLSPMASRALATRSAFELRWEP